MTSQQFHHAGFVLGEKTHAQVRVHELKKRIKCLLEDRSMYGLRDYTFNMKLKEHPFEYKVTMNVDEVYCLLTRHLEEQQKELEKYTKEFAAL